MFSRLLKKHNYLDFLIFILNQKVIQQCFNMSILKPIRQKYLTAYTHKYAPSCISSYHLPFIYLYPMCDLKLGSNLLSSLKHNTQFLKCILFLSHNNLTEGTLIRKSFVIFQKYMNVIESNCYIFI